MKEKDYDHEKAFKERITQEIVGNFKNKMASQEEEEEEKKNMTKDYSCWNMELVIGCMFQAHKQAEKSVCLKKKVGAVLVGEYSGIGIIEGQGYGGAKDPCKVCVRKQYDWQQDGCWAVHSEPRAIFDYFSKFRYKSDLSNHIIFVTHGPCDQCIKYCYEFNITNMVYDISYHNDYSKWTGKVNIYKLDRDKMELIWENPLINKGERNEKSSVRSIF